VCSPCVCPGPKCSVWPITHRDFRDLHLLANQSSSICENNFRPEPNFPCPSHVATKGARLTVPVHRRAYISPIHQRYIMHGDLLTCRSPTSTKPPPPFTQLETTTQAAPKPCFSLFFTPRLPRLSPITQIQIQIPIQSNPTFPLVLAYTLQLATCNTCICTLQPLSWLGSSPDCSNSFYITIQSPLHRLALCSIGLFGWQLHLSFLSIWIKAK